MARAVKEMGPASVYSGGVEDTRLEAKDRPSRSQGHRRKCLQKKGPQNFFQAIST